MDPDGDNSRLVQVAWYTLEATSLLQAGVCQPAYFLLYHAVRLAAYCGPDDHTGHLRQWVLCMSWAAQRLCRVHGYDTQALCVILTMMRERLSQVPASAFTPRDRREVSLQQPPFSAEPCCCHVPVDRCS